MIYMGSIKDEGLFLSNLGEDINIENWSMSELKKVVKDYRQCLNEEVKWEKEKLSRLRQSK